MQRNSQSQQRPGGGFPRRNFYNKQQQNRANSASQTQKSDKWQAVATRSLNPLNQYFSDKFLKLKKDADLRGMKNQAFCYKRVLAALAKYPLPILCIDQAMYLEGVGDTVAQRFNQIIKEREKEYEDQVFYLSLAQEQRAQVDTAEGTSAAANSNFAGLTLQMINQLNVSIEQCSLRQILLKLDKLNFKNSANVQNIIQSKKRKRPVGQEEGATQGDQNNDKRKKTNVESGFMEMGSVSWTMMLAIYFLSLHQGVVANENLQKNEQQEYAIDFNSVVEMIEALKDEFGAILPLQTSHDILKEQFSGVLVQMRENNLISVHSQSNQKLDPFEWKFFITQKGTVRAKALCKAAGLICKVEVDLQTSQNKITIDLYDKELIPVVDDLYLQDQSVIMTKQEGEDKNDANLIFDPFISDIEKLACECQQISGQSLKGDESALLIGDLLDDEKQINLDECNLLTQTQQDQGFRHLPCKSEVILYVDNREKRNQADTNYFFDRLCGQGLKIEQKSLPLGDFLWVLRVYNNSQQTQQLKNDLPSLTQVDQPSKNKSKRSQMPAFTDYILDFIVERKTADDLAASILDGRYEEQKFRLKNCGLSNVIYLVEGTPSQHCKIPEVVLKKAQIHTQIFHNFNVMRFATIQDSLRWLVEMTEAIGKKILKMSKEIDNFQDRIATSLLDFKTFQTESGKSNNMTVQQIFSRQLRTVKGLGIDNCSTVTRVFKTPFLLQMCFKQAIQINSKAPEQLINSAKLELERANVGANAHNAEETYQETGGDNLPQQIRDTDRVNLGSVVQTAAEPKVLAKLFKQHEQEYGIKLRRVGNKPSKILAELFVGNQMNLI